LNSQAWEISGDFVITGVNAWTDACMKSFFPKTTLSFSPHLVINVLTQKRFYPGEHAFGVFGKKHAFFIVPWMDQTMIGTYEKKFEGDPALFRGTQSVLNAFLQEFNEAYPAAALRLEDLCFHHYGFIPGNVQSGNSLRHFAIHDHETDSGLKNVLTVLAVKYTTARHVAEKTVDRIFEKIKRAKIPSQSKEKKLPNSHLEIEKWGEQNPAWKEKIPGSKNIPVTELVYAVQEEMALTLSDLILRRTNLGSAQCPADETLNFCAHYMGSLLGWNEEEKQRQIHQVQERYRWVQ
jgi:glycerol-3-phosphate dehydrogenase